MKKTMILTAALTALLLLAGCGTIMNHTRLEPEAYKGVRYDYHWMSKYGKLSYATCPPAINQWEPIACAGVCLIYGISLPFSAIFDTLLFPVDYFYLSGGPPLFPREPDPDRKPMDPQ